MLHIDNLFDDFFEDFDKNFFDPHRSLPMPKPREAVPMRTDVKELKNSYKLKIDLPGYAKEDIKIKLDEGFLAIDAEKNTEKTEADEEDGKIIRRERFVGSMSRIWYVGEELKQEDIKAKYANGVLTVTVPKLKDKEKLPEDKKYIAID